MRVNPTINWINLNTRYLPPKFSAVISTAFISGMNERDLSNMTSSHPLEAVQLTAKPFGGKYLVLRSRV